MLKITHLLRISTLIFFLLFGLNSIAQVGVGTTTPSAGSIFDVTSTNKGVLVPRVDIANLATIAPVTGGATDGLLVWNTRTGTGIGYHYWSVPLGRWIPLLPTTATSNDWTLIGNTLTAAEGGNITADGTSFLGTTNSRNLNFRTNNLQRGRFSNLGEFFVGTNNTVIPGDLMNAVGNATFDWAVNGYTAFNGGGVYGGVTLDGTTGTGGTTLFAGVQGEYMGTNRLGPGVRGLTFTTTAGTNFLGTTVSGVSGSLSTGNIQRSVGVMGTTGDNFGVRAGGVLGTDLFASGALGYFASNFISYSVFSFGDPIVIGGPGGRSSNENTINTHVGMGIYGGFMGGWIKGSEYGAMFSGERFGSYTQGKNITNDTFVVLDEKPDGNKQISYASTSMTIDIQDRGMGNLTNGTSRISFGQNFSEIVDGNKPIIVTVTPFGETNGVHLVSVDKTGFVIKENSDGQSNTQFNWIAIAEKSNKKGDISKELLSKDFDNNTELFMHNDNLDGAKAVWYENGEIKFGDRAPFNEKRIENYKSQPEVARQKKTKVSD